MVTNDISISMKCHACKAGNHAAMYSEVLVLAVSHVTRSFDSENML